MNHKIINNFLPIDYFNRIQWLLLHPRLEWFYKDYSADMNSDDGHSFVHVFWNEGKPTSDLFKEFYPFLEQLKVKNLIQLRANLLVRDNKYSKCADHIDFENSDNTTGIFYINNNNGYTLLGETKVESVENRLLLFPVNVKHASVRQTDTSRRIVLNINYT